MPGVRVGTTRRRPHLGCGRRVAMQAPLLFGLDAATGCRSGDLISTSKRRSPCHPPLPQARTAPSARRARGAADTARANRRQHCASADPDPLPSWNDGPRSRRSSPSCAPRPTQARPELRAAGRAHRHLRPGRHAVGRAPMYIAGGLLPRAGAGVVKAKPELANGRAVQDRARPATARQWQSSRCRTWIKILCSRH